MTTAQKDYYQTINFEETELRLGLPGGITTATAVGSGTEGMNIPIKNGKRGFDETVDDVDLKLNLSSTANNTTTGTSMTGSKDVMKIDMDQKKMKEKALVDQPQSNSEHSKPPAKAQVVGWPPVRSFRKNIMAVQKPNAAPTELHTTANKKKEAAEITAPAEKSSSAAAVPATTTSNAVASVVAAFVKVSMDGAPYLRKVDLKQYKSYQELSDALTKMFSSFTKDLMGENKLANLLNSSDYVPTYEDKDGDWMLVGDVPWEMFVDSCKRLRIMKGSEAVGLSPRTVLREKCKTRS